MSRLWVTGYRNYEIGTFGDKDPKIEVIKYALNRTLREHLKREFPALKVAMMLPFQKFGSQWKPDNQARLQSLISKSDFCESVSQAPYEGPQQLKNYQQFMLTHTDGAILVYDLDFEGKPVYDYRAIQKQQSIVPYPLTTIDMDQLQDYATEYEEIHEEKSNFYE